MATVAAVLAMVTGTAAAEAEPALCADRGIVYFINHRRCGFYLLD